MGAYKGVSLGFYDSFVGANQCVRPLGQTLNQNGLGQTHGSAPTWIMIEGVRIKRLKVIPDERGRLMEILRRDEDYFRGFGQVYVSTCYPGIVKGWHYHKRQTDNIAVVSGMAKVVLHDLREGSPTRWDTEEYFIGIHNPVLVQIPPMVAHGLKAIDSESIFINCPTEPYDYKEPDEYRIDPHSREIEYDWSRRNG